MIKINLSVLAEKIDKHKHHETIQNDSVSNVENQNKEEDDKSQKEKSKNKQGKTVFKVNYNRLIEIAKIWNDRSSRVQHLILNNVPFVNKSEELPSLYDADSELAHISELISMPRDASLLFLLSAESTVPIPCPEDIQVSPVSISSLIQEPPPFSFGNITWSKGEHRPIPKWRYIPNYDVHDCMEKVDAVLSNSQSNKESSIFRESRLYKQLITTVLNQSRGLNISRMCVMIMLVACCVPKKFTIHHCAKEVNPAIYYLQQLLGRYVSWPFLDNVNAMVYPYKVKISTQLPLLVYSVLNRGISFCLGAITIGYFNLAMSCYIEWAESSIDDMHLSQKGDMNSVRKLLHERVFNSDILQFGQFGILGNRHVSQVKEFWVDHEYEKLLMTLEETKTTRLYYKVVKDLMSRRFNRDELSLHKIALACCTNNSLYKKSSPTLEYDRSAEHKIHNPAIMKHARLKWGPFPIDLRYEGVFKMCYDQLLEYGELMKQHMKERDFEAEFWQRLTNNSGGYLADAVIQKKNSDPLMQAMPSIPYGQRYVSALLDNDNLYNRELAFEALSNRIKAGKREQIDRRSRWIMMVSNVLQVVFSVALSFGKEVTKMSDYIASGKQVGDVRDMLQTLRASSSVNTIITDNDIKGMDSSTQEQVADMVLHAVFHSLDGLEINQFFYASSQEVLCKEYDESGRETGRSEKRRLNAVQIFIAEIAGRMRTTNYEFTEGWVDMVTYISGAVFWSGAFHTAVQHNTLLSSMLSKLQTTIRQALDHLQGRFNGSVMGDDISLELSFNQENDVTDEAARECIALFQSYLFELGFISEPEASRCQSTFLQQTAFLGGVEPKHARLSIIVAETGEGRKKDPFELVKEVGDILDELSGRSPYPENSIPILWSFWVVARVMSIRLYDISEKNRARLMTVAAKLHRWVKLTRDVVITIPFYSLILPEVFGVTPPPMFIRNYGMLRPSFFCPKGTFTYWLLSKAFRKQLSSEEYEHLLRSEQARVRRSIERRYKKGEISVEKKLLLEQQTVIIPPYEMIDHELLRHSGLVFGQWLYRTVPKNSRMSDEDINNPAFQTLINIGVQKLNQERLSQSLLAKSLLLDANVQVPDGIGYFSQPKNRLTQAFVLHDQKQGKIRVHDSKTIDKLLQLNLDDYRLVIPDPALCDFDVLPTSVPIMLSPDACVLGKASLSCCAPNSSLTHHLMMLCGTPFGNNSADVISENLKGELNVGADVETILTYATKIYRQSPTYLSLFFSFIGIPPRMFPRVKKYVEDYMQVGLIQYSSVMNVRKFFFINTNATISERLIATHARVIGKPQWSRLQYAITRDFFLAFPSTASRVQIIPSTSLLNRIAHG